MTPHERIISARVKLLLDQPFFGSLAMKLQIKPDPTAPTAWTDGKTLAYNPEFIEKLSDAEVQFLTAHEVLHCVLHHPSRRGTREPRRWNIAGDYCINLLLQDAGFKMIKGGLIDKQFSGHSTDDIYCKIPPPPPGSNGAGQGDNPDPGGCGEVRDAPGGSEAEAEAQAADWTIYTAQAAQQAKLAGKLPAGIARLVENMLEPKADWKEILRRFVMQTVKDCSTWNRGNRRHIAKGLYLPSKKRREELPPLILAVDTSGSVGQRELDNFAAEMTGILDAYPATLKVVYCDSEIYPEAVQTFTRDDLPLKLDAKGGGGTDFDPVFEWISEQAEQPAALIYLTDLYGHATIDPPEYPVLWASIDERGYNQPFGERINII